NVPITSWVIVVGSVSSSDLLLRVPRSTQSKLCFAPRRMGRYKCNRGSGKRCVTSLTLFRAARFGKASNQRSSDDRQDRHRRPCPLAPLASDPAPHPVDPRGAPETM